MLCRPLSVVKVSWRQAEFKAALYYFKLLIILSGTHILLNGLSHQKHRKQKRYMYWSWIVPLPKQSPVDMPLVMNLCWSSSYSLHIVGYTSFGCDVKDYIRLPVSRANIISQVAARDKRKLRCNEAHQGTNYDLSMSVSQPGVDGITVNIWRRLWPWLSTDPHCHFLGGSSNPMFN